MKGLTYGPTHIFTEIIALRTSLKLFLAFTALHVLKLAYWFQNVDFKSPFPIINHDFIMYYARCLRFKDFWEVSGRWWGYDPFQMAGYIAGPVHEMGSHFLSLAVFALSHFFPMSGVFNWIVCFCFVIMPFFAYFSVRNFGGSAEDGVLGFGIAVLLFGIFEPMSAAVALKGMFGFLFSLFVGLWQVSLLWACLKMSRWSRWVMWGGVTGALFLIHPVALIFIMVPNVLIYLLAFRRWRPRDELMLFAMLLLAAAINWHWIHPYLAFRDWRVEVFNFFPGGWSALRNILNPANLLFFPFLRWSFLLLLAWGFVASIAGMWRRDQHLAVVLMGWVAWLVLVAYFGDKVPFVRTIQPGRFAGAVWLVMGVGAALFLWERIKRVRYVTLPALLVLITFFHTLSRQDSLLFVNSFSWQQNAVIEFIQNRELKGRFLLECDEEDLPNYADYLPVVTRKPFLGGSNPGNPLITRFTLFTGSSYGREGLVSSPIIFNRPLLSMAPRELKSYLDLYNVEYIGARNAAAVGYFKKCRTFLTEDGLRGGTHIFKVKGPRTWFVQGEGELRFDFDHITVQNATGDDIIIKAHFLKTMFVLPPAAVRPIYLMDDPVPFIKVENPGRFSEISIFNGGLERL